MPTRFNYFLTEALRGLLYNKFMSFVVIANIGIALFFVSVFLTAFLNLNQLIESAEDKITFEVFLEDQAPAIDVMKRALLATSGVVGADYISKEEAYAIFRKEVSSDILTAVDGNPLPASFKLTLSRDDRSPEKLKVIRENLKTIPFVEEVTEVKDWVQKLQRVRNVFASVSLIASIVLCLAIFFMVFSTLRVTCFARSDLFKVLELVGAPETAIRVPFILEGAIKGFLGGLMAYFLLLIAMAFVRTSFPDIVLYNKIFLVLTALGLFLGSVASVTAVNNAAKA